MMWTNNGLEKPHQCPEKLGKLPQEAILIFAALKTHFSLPKNQIGSVTGLAGTTLTSLLDKLVKFSYIDAKKYRAHTYYFINPEMTKALDPEVLREAIIQLHPLPQLAVTEPTRVARTCYGHLAGILGISLKEKLIAAGLILEKNNQFELTECGILKFARIGLNGCYTIPHCLDCTERKFHLAGDFGKALTEFFFHARWIEYSLPYTRAVTVTEFGRKNFFLNLIYY